MATQGYLIANVGGDKTGASATGYLNVITGSLSKHVINVGGDKTGASATGLANDSTTYNANWVYLDSSASGGITIEGQNAQTFNDLISALSSSIEGGGGSDLDIFLENGNLVIGSSVNSYGKSFFITDTNLFSQLSGFVEVEDLIPGADDLHPAYGAQLTGTVNTHVEVLGDQVQTFGELITRIQDGVFVTGFLAELDAGNIKLTAPGYGASSTINASDVTQAARKHFDFSGSVTAGGTTGLDSGTTYEFRLRIRATDFFFQILGSDAPTFGDLVDEVNAVLGSAGTMEVTGDNNLHIIDNQAGADSFIRYGSTVDIVNPLIESLTGYASNGFEIQGEGPLFASLSGFVELEAVPGAANLQYYQIVNVGGNKTTSTGPTGLLQANNFSHGYHRCNFTSAKTMGSATGLANDTTEYTCTIDIRGVEHLITVLGQDAQTLQDLAIAIINQITPVDGHQLSLNTTHTLPDGSVASGDLFIFTYDTDPAQVGVGSSIAVEDDDLFLHLTDFDGFDAPVGGIDNGYSAVINVDGVPLTVKLNGGSQASVVAMNNCRLFYFLIINNFNAQIASVASTATKLEIFQGNLRLVSEVPISIDDDAGPGNPLFSSLTGFVAINPPAEFGASVNNRAIARGIAESISAPISE